MSSTCEMVENIPQKDKCKKFHRDENIDYEPFVAHTVAAARQVREYKFCVSKSSRHPDDDDTFFYRMNHHMNMCFSDPKGVELHNAAYKMPNDKMCLSTNIHTSEPVVCNKKPQCDPTESFIKGIHG